MTRMTATRRISGVSSHVRQIPSHGPAGCGDAVHNHIADRPVPGQGMNGQWDSNLPSVSSRHMSRYSRRDALTGRGTAIRTRLTLILSRLASIGRNTVVLLRPEPRPVSCVLCNGHHSSLVLGFAFVMIHDGTNASAGATHH